MVVRRSGSVVLAMALSAACTTPASDVADPSPSVGQPTSSPAGVSHRPLRLPSVTPGGQCPVASVTRRGGGSAGSEAVLGDAPLGPVSYYFDNSTAVLRLRPDDRAVTGGYAKKVRWLAIDFTGPIVIRAARIDGKGQARVEFSYTGRAIDDAFAADVHASGRIQDFPALTYVSGPGCYAYQLDTADSSYTIVFAAVTG